MLTRRFFAFVISAFLIFFPAYSYAASPNGWAASPADIIMNGASSTINAVKGSGSSALQSTIRHAPAAGRVAKHIVKVGGVGAVAMAVTQILGSGIDWVLDPANNRVKYTVGGATAAPAGKTWRNSRGNTNTDPLALCRLTFSSLADTEERYQGVTGFNGSINGRGEYECRAFYSPAYGGKEFTIARFDLVNAAPNEPPYQPEEKYIPYSQVAQKIISNAASAEPSSQEFVKTIAVEDLESGALDVPLNTNAVPKADNPPVTDPNNPPVTDPDAPVPPFDPSSIISAIKSVMAAVVNMSGVLGAKFDALMVEMGLQNAETQKVINDGMADVVAANNATGARVGDVVAAIEALEGNTLDGQVINDAVDRVIANDDVKVGDIVAAIEAIEGNTLDGQVINDAVDRVIANDNVNAQAAADAAAAAADAAKAADAANTAAVTDAIGAQTDAISETDPVTGVKSLKLPAFCSWALPVCDFFGWVAEPVPADEEKKDVPFATTGDIGLDDVDRFEKRIDFSGQCPVNDFSFTMMGVTYAKPIPYHHLCGFLEQIAPWLLAMCYLGVAYFVVENI